MHSPKITTLTGSSAMLICAAIPAHAVGTASFVDGQWRSTISATTKNDLRSYTLTTNAPLRDNLPADKKKEFSESKDHAQVRTGNLMFDGLYALAVHETVENSVSQIKDGAYGNGTPIPLQAFETGRLWNYVWTRDLSYSVHLALANFDPDRAANSLFFKTSVTKPGVAGGYLHQIVQDTGSGGSYPVSTDRVVWALGAYELLKYLPDSKREATARRVYSILHDTLEQDRVLIFDPKDGLYRGEHSFLDWREQSYPSWTKDNVLAIATSKALSVNAANFFAITMAAELAGKLGLPKQQQRYKKWAAQLKTAINQHFYDAKTGLYSTYLLADGEYPIRVKRYDLLGESLAILTGVAAPSQAQTVIASYPTGRFGPPVLWPQDSQVPIYHNHGIWPFVTAYWLKAAKKADNAAAVDNGVQSLMRGAALNLSNMENLDVGTGQAFKNEGQMRGPVINSQRQVWSVSGYLSMVQDIVFGLETSWDGIRFTPYITEKMRAETFRESTRLILENFHYRGKTIEVRVHLPKVTKTGNAALEVDRIELNGKPIGTDFVPFQTLFAHNIWNVFLRVPPSAQKPSSLTVFNENSNIFGPLPPVWEKAGNQDHTLHYTHPNPTGVTFNIYRDGQLCAEGVQTLSWEDKEPGNHFYTLEAVDKATGLSSHLTTSRYLGDSNNLWQISASTMENKGGNLVNDHHFENWGQSNHELLAKGFLAAETGKYLLRFEFSNGAASVQTGITCAVKKVEVRDVDTNVLIASGYVTMPQSGDWTRFDLSSMVPVHLLKDHHYNFRLYEDEYSRNMSFFQSNERYTAASGGGPHPYNYVNIASLQLMRVGEAEGTP